MDNQADNWVHKWADDRADNPGDNWGGGSLDPTLDIWSNFLKKKHFIILSVIPLLSARSSAHLCTQLSAWLSIRLSNASQSD